ncbi:unnamed protein product [Cladocopium goreaui]|uniref:Uncharacterized protein n=1 Tax=Cladocopium goreaui TaxID=2562237 RepID=A0A9P1FUW3_9DINO|nr:unnamed protein product [Cladocopium goreaui]
MQWHIGKNSPSAMFAFAVLLACSVWSGEAAPEGSIAAVELEKRFEQLKAMASAEGKAADPEFLQMMEDLEKQLQGLKEGQEQLQKSQEEAERSRKQTAMEDSTWVAACFAMATESLGGSLSKELFEAVGRAAEDNMTLEEAAELPLFRMATVCLGKRLDEGETARTQEMFKHVTMGLKRGRKPPPLPEAWVEESASDEVKEQVRHLSPWAWNLLKMQAGGAVYNSKWYNRGPPSFFLVFALPVPLYYAVQWLLRKLRGEPGPPEIKDDKKKGDAKKVAKKDKEDKEEEKKEDKKDK